MQRIISVCLAGLLLLAGTTRAGARGTETFGNKPLGPENYEAWPGIMPVINHETRIYQSWVNGSERFCYEGDIAALNALLVDFAGIQVEGKRVVLRPEPGLVQTFQGMELDMQWDLQIVGGIAAHMTKLDKGDLVWSKAPVLSVYVGREIDVTRIVFPRGVTVVGVSDLKQQYATAVSQSTDTTVRGWGCGSLAALDPFDAESLHVIAARLDDKESWVQLNAAGALATFGAKAKSALPALRDAAQSSDDALKQRAAETIATIEAAKAQDAAERRHVQLLAEIDKVVAARRKQQR